jgi:hypothetical protein
MICSLAKWCETNYQGNASQPMLQTEGKKQVISEFQDWNNFSLLPRGCGRRKEEQRRNERKEGKEGES